MQRKGNTLVIILALALLLAVQIYIVNVFTTFGFRHVGRTNAHIRAIATAEGVFSRFVARLKGAPWADRWFKTGAVTEKDVSLGRATYSSYVATVVHPDQKLADVWIEARYEGSVAPMFWRVRYLDEGLDLYAQVQPQFFTFLPGNVPPPTSPSGAGPMTTVVEGMISEQTRNRPQAIDAVAALAGTPSLSGVLGTLGLTPVPGIQDETFPYGATAPRPQSAYQSDVAGEVGAPGPLPAPSGGAVQPPQQSLVDQYPNPSQFPQVVQNVFTQLSMGDPAVPTATHFADPTRAQSAWTQAITDQSASDFRSMLRDFGDYIKQMASKYEQTGNATTFDALMGMMDYLKGATANEAARAGRSPPNASRTDLRPYTASQFDNALKAYGDWWF